MWWRLRRRRQQHVIEMPRPGHAGNGREQAAADALARTERASEVTDALIRRMDRLGDDVREALTLRPRGDGRGHAHR